MIEPEPQGVNSPDIAKAENEIFNNPNDLYPKPVPRHVLEKIVAGIERYPTSEGLKTFEELFTGFDGYFTPDAIGKFDIAYAVILDGRYKNATSRHKDLNFLVEQFIMPKDRSEALPLMLQDRLRLLMVEKGHIEFGTKEEALAKDAFARMVLSDDDLMQLCQTLPIGFMGALASIKFYHNAGQDERERLRSFSTRALLRPYMGNFMYRRPMAELDFSSMIRLIPEQVFTDETTITINLAKHYLVNQALKLFIDGEDQGFSKLHSSIDQEESEIKKKFLQGILEEFKQVQALQIPESFKQYILDESINQDDNERSFYKFPAFRQKYFAYQFIKKQQMLLCAGTGAAKTASALLPMKMLNRERVVVFGPANARLTWPEQAEKHFKTEETPEVFVVTTRADLDDPRLTRAEYVYVSSELLSSAIYSPNPLPPGLSEEQQEQAFARQQIGYDQAAQLRGKLMTKLVVERGTDAVITDEAQVFRNPDAQCTQIVSDLIEAIRRKYIPDSKSPKLPILALTATPIYSDLDDLDVNMAFLYPESFAMPGQETRGHYTFSSSCDFNPEVAFIKLYGENLLMQWSTEDLFGDKVPTVKFDDIEKISLDMTPELEVLYDWMIKLDKVMDLKKIWLLRGLLINPLVIKDLNKRHNWYQTDSTVEELDQRFLGFFANWKEWSSKRNPQLEPEPFSADFIALQPGGPEFLLDAFFHDKLFHGFESLAGMHPEIKAQSYIPATPSPKTEYIKRMVRDRFSKNGDKYQSKTKMVIVSNEQTLGITRYMDDENAGEILDAFSVYEMALWDWLPGISRDQAINIDSKIGIARRREIAKSFREDPEKYLLMILNRESMEVSIDMAPRAIMNSIDDVHVNFLGMTFSATPIIQHSGRYVRPGVAKPVNFSVTESNGTIDDGLSISSRKSYLVNEVALAGVKLDLEDAEFLDKTKIARRIIKAADANNEYLIREMLTKLRGIGENKMLESLRETERNEKTRAEIWAELYIDQGNDMYRVVGNNAELVANSLLQNKPKRILSVGAGSCLLDRKLKEKGFPGIVVNIDINKDILDQAKELYPQIGDVNHGVASNLSFEDGEFDCIDCSFMLDMSKFFEDPGLGTLAPTHQIERVRILTEMNRVLKIGGTAVITLPQHSLDESSYTRFAASLENLGFKLKGDINGEVYTTDTEPEHRIGWIYTLEKISDVNPTNFNPMELMLLTDDIYRVSRYRGDKKPQYGQIEIANTLFDAREFVIFNPVENKTVNTGSPVVVEMDEEASIAWEKISSEFLTQAMNPNENQTKIEQLLSDIVSNLNINQRNWWMRSWKLIKDQLIRYEFYSAGSGLEKLQDAEFLAKTIAGKMMFDHKLYTYETLRYHNFVRKTARNSSVEFLRNIL